MRLREMWIMVGYHYKIRWQRFLTPKLIEYAKRKIEQRFEYKTSNESFKRRKAVNPYLTEEEHIDHQLDLMTIEINYPQTWDLMPNKKLSRAALQLMCASTIGHEISLTERDVEPTTDRAYCHCRWCDKKMYVDPIEAKLILPDRKSSKNAGKRKTS